ncbi:MULTISPECIES: cbb3-type cytochrome oxidase assembly protein CcoS [unclassified Sulfurospirillum]|uniref:cbb3-type cytochrome oxidase assembly protein CcoS n=1 Tax=unclassified Sulfurospirillum TaxID=2618290 RepID=UPI00050533C1|nr:MULTISPECIES: cbb3-type cytochrome oxidase assembly protein CcoS [unclassified Sulfurospirillum]KFL34008.1 cytochrome oxidase maturation protein Cbb3 [Sulfurospirillum sp. SCADC]
MDGWVVGMMLGASTLLGAFGLWALLWGIRSGQFDDHKKFIDGAQFDSEEALRDAVMMERKKADILKEKKQRESKYAPPD